MQINISMLYLENLKFFFLRNKRFIKDHKKPHCQELQKMKNTNLIKPIQIAQVTLQFWEIKLRKTKQKNKFERILWVRSISFPGSTPVCGVFFFQDERVQIITHVRPGEKKPPHTGVDPGKLKERTLYVTVFAKATCSETAQLNIIMYFDGVNTRGCI